MITEEQLQEWERLVNEAQLEYVGVSCLPNGLYRMDMPRVCYEFVRATPETLPALIAEVRRLREENKEIWMQGYVTGKRGGDWS